MAYPVQLLESERDAIKHALGKLYYFCAPADHEARVALMSLLERSAPPLPDVRYVVFCKGYKRRWKKVFYEKRQRRPTLDMRLICGAGATMSAFSGRSGSSSDVDR